jgi:hypothetical protein
MFGRMANTFRGLLLRFRPASESGDRLATVAAVLSPPRTVAGDGPTPANGEWPDLLMDGARSDPVPPPSRPLPQVVFAGGDEGDPFSLALGLSPAR